MLVTFLVRSTKVIRPARGAMSVERSSQKKSILGLNQASEQSDSDDQDSSKGTDQRLAKNRS
jgi:hypothetical protein